MKRIFLTLFLFPIFIFYCSESDTITSESFADVSTIQITKIREKENVELPILVLDDKDEVNVAIGVYLSLSGGILFLADGLGFFREQNLNVTMKLYGDYKSLIEGFKNNEVDIATIGLYESMSIALEDIDFVGVAPLIYKRILFMVSKDNYIGKIAKNIENEIKNIKNGKDINIERSSEDILTVNYKVNDESIETIYNIEEEIKNINRLEGKIIGLDLDSIAYYILNNILINEVGLVLKEVDVIPIPDTQLKSEIFKGLTDIGAFTEFNKLDKESGGVMIFDSTNYKTHTVESLLVHRDFAIKSRDAVKKIIIGWKKAIAFLKRYPSITEDIMSDRSRLNTSKDELRKAIATDPIIPIMNSPGEYLKSGKSVEATLKESFFNQAGNYSVEAGQLLDFIAKNYEKYNKIEYQKRIQGIKNKLESGYYYNIVYLESATFDEPDISKIRTVFAPRRFSMSSYNEIINKVNEVEKKVIMENYPQESLNYVLNQGISPEIDNHIVNILRKIGYTNFASLYEAIDRTAWVSNLQYIPVDYGSIDWKDIYPKKMFAPKAIKIDIFEKELLTKLSRKDVNYITKRYTKKLYHYIKKEISSKEDDKIIEMLNKINYKDMNKLESKEYDKYKEEGIEVKTLGTGEDDVIGFSFKYNYAKYGEFKP